MSKLWPEGNDGTLLQLVSKYLKGLSQNSSIDEETRDSLSVSVDCLSSILQSGNVTVSDNNDLSLVSMYEKCKDSFESKESESLSKEELTKRLNKFSQFVKVLETKNFFKNAKEGSEEYTNLLDTARKQWNQRFPQLKLDSLELITKNDTNTTNELDPQKAEAMKTEGNAALLKKDYKTAISKYTEAIKFNPNNAIYHSNRSAAYCYIKDYQNAAIDARKATEVDPKYVKAWVRLGVSEFELGNFEGAQTAYNEALQLTPATDKNWELYMERVQLCEQKLSGSGSNTNNDDEDGDDIGMDGSNGNIPNMGNMGNMPDMSQLGNLFQGMGGMDGLNNLMQNPMFSQMANNLMKDPNMMANLSNMMSNPDTMNNLFGGGGGGAGPGPNNSQGGDSTNDEMKENFQKLMQDPQKAQQVFKKAMDDEEVKQLMTDPEVAALVTRIKNGDYTAMLEATKKPELMTTVRKLLKKYSEE